MKHSLFSLPNILSNACIVCIEQNSEWKYRISQTHGDRNVAFMPQNNEKIHAEYQGFSSILDSRLFGDPIHPWNIFLLCLSRFCITQLLTILVKWQKITIGPAVYIVGTTKFIRSQSRSKKAEASKVSPTKIVCCKFDHYYQVMLLNCSCKFAIIVENEINPKKMALRSYRLTTDNNITIDILSLFQTTLPHLERQPLISS